MGHVHSEALLQQSLPVVNWKCESTQFDMYNGRSTVTVVVAKRCCSVLNNDQCWFLTVWIKSSLWLLNEYNDMFPVIGDYNRDTENVCMLSISACI